MTREGESPMLQDEQIERAAIWGDLDPAPVAALERMATDAATPPTQRSFSVLAKIPLAVVGLWLFLVALAFMKDGARGLAPSLGLAIETPLNALGFGWLAALLVLSGSPIAASSLALLAGGSLDVEQSYAMVVGSRIGAAFVVLVVATIYALRSPDAGRRTTLSIGVLALATTAVAYVPGGLLGLLLLRSDLLAGVSLAPPSAFFDVIDAITAPALGLAAGVVDARTVPGGAVLFAAGVGLLLLSFRIVDVFLPTLSGAADDERARWYVGPWTMFGIGLAVALATLSVSVALSVLVPLVARGYVRREQVLPYIAGANITTLADTLLVAVLVGNESAPRVVLSLAVGVTIWTVTLLLVAYQPTRSGVFSLQSVILVNRRRLLIFVGLLFACPLGMLLIR